jgi:hypothetical protein
MMKDLHMPPSTVLMTKSQNMRRSSYATLMGKIDYSLETLILGIRNGL